MKSIKRMVSHIDDELKGAERYAENMITAIASGDNRKAETYKSMADDEMKHATTLHTMAQEMIDNISNVYTAPPEMLEKWETSHNDYIKRTAYIKQMLSVYKG